MTTRLFLLLNPSLRPPRFPWGPDVEPTRRMLLLFMAEYMDLVAQRQRRTRPFKMAGLYALIVTGAMNVGSALATANWPWMLLHVASTSLLVWVGLVRKPNQRQMLDNRIADLKRGAEQVRTLVKTRAATWLDEPPTGGEEL